MAFSRGGTRFAVGGTDGTIRLFLLPPLIPKIEGCVYQDGPVELDAHNGYVTTLEFNSESDRLLSG